MECISTSKSVEQNRWKFGTQLYELHIYTGYLNLILCCSRSFWGHWMHLSENGLLLKMAVCRAKWSEIWDSAILVTHTCDTLAL